MPPINPIENGTENSVKIVYNAWQKWNIITCAYINHMFFFVLGKFLNRRVSFHRWGKSQLLKNWHKDYHAFKSSDQAINISLYAIIYLGIVQKTIVNLNF